MYLVPGFIKYFLVMKKLFALSILFMALVIMASCDKKEELDITMTLVEDGNLRITLIDDLGTDFSNLTVEMYSGYGGILEEKTTNSSGEALFENILYGTYQIVIEDIAVGSKNFNVVQIVQVVASKTKTMSINPAEYSGTVRLELVDYSSNPVEGLQVIVFSTSDYSDNYELSDIQGIAVETGVSDSDGMVVMEEMPLDDYGLCIYSDDAILVLSSYMFYLGSKGDEVRYMVEVPVF